MSASKEQRILVLAPFGRDGPLACQIIGEAGLEAQLCASLPELCAQVAEGAAAVLLTEEVLAVKEARSLLTLLESQPPWSDLPVIVFGASLATLGEFANVTLLDRPVRIRTLVSAVRASLRARNRQYLARDLLDELQQSVRDRDQFLAMLGHELRNPLAAILAASELLDREAGAGHPRPRAVIGRQVRHLGRLVDDLLDVARITTGKISLHLGPVELRELVARSVQTYEGEAAQRKLTLSATAPGRPIVLSADRVRVDQIVANILANAIKYTPAGGRIEVETAAEGGFGVLRVRDTGVGISAAMLPRIFDLFAQAPGTLDRAQGGMGIGLTLVQRLVSLHGGTVAARSEGEGKGSEFEVRLPLSTVEEKALGPRPGSLASRAFLVMVAEDNADLRELLQTALEHLGLRIETCSDGPSAVARALLEKPAAMIVDLGLPGKDGYQVAREVRAALGAGVRLIALTGYGQPEDKARAEAAGFDGFLTKPVEMEEIFAALTAESSATVSPGKTPEA